MSLDDIDVVVLRETMRVQGHYDEGQRASLPQKAAMDSWDSGAWRNLGIDAGQLDGSCGKLQSLALIMRLDRPNNINVLAPIANKYLLLSRGVQFVNAIRERASVNNADATSTA
jgi:hypothetical protein